MAQRKQCIEYFELDMWNIKPDCWWCKATSCPKRAKLPSPELKTITNRNQRFYEVRDD